MRGSMEGAWNANVVMPSPTGEKVVRQDRMRGWWANSSIWRLRSRDDPLIRGFAHLLPVGRRERRGVVD